MRSPEDQPDPALDFFISYTRADLPWAEWIAWQLEDAGYQVLVQVWDFVPGSHWAKAMEYGMARATRTLAVVSPQYLTSVYGRAEWEAAYKADPKGFSRKLVPVRITACDMPGFLGQVVYIDLFDRPEAEARRWLLNQIGVVIAGRAKPTMEPAFPDELHAARPHSRIADQPSPSQETPPPSPAYPGAAGPPLNVDFELSGEISGSVDDFTATSARLDEQLSPSSERLWLERADYSAGLDKNNWDRLIDELRSGDCTPVLGSGINYTVRPTHSELARQWANRYHYPFDNDADLAQVMQYIGVQMQDSMLVKTSFAEELQAVNPPDFTDVAQPHAVLARLPLAVYITTNYDDFMESALSQAGRRPKSLLCPWYKGAVTEEWITAVRGLVPSAAEPIVYHLWGSVREPPSMVLTEEDHLEFAFNLIFDQGSDNRRIVPTPILSALTVQPLLFVGQSMQDLSFRFLLKNLLMTISPVRQRRHIAVQLPLPLSYDEPDRTRLAYKYLAEYLAGWQILSYWGTPQDFCAELAVRLGYQQTAEGPAVDD